MQATKTDTANLDRLKKRSDFLRVQKEGQKWIATGLIVQAAPRKQPDEAAGRIRFGLTVSGRLSGSAVIRNRMKRRLRAVAHDILPARARPGTDYVLIGRRETASRAYQDLRNDLAWCLQKLSDADNQAKT